MPITMPCPVCGAKLKAPDTAAGRIVNCPGCLTPVQLPLAAPPVPRNPPAPPTLLRPPPAPTEVLKKTGYAEPPKPSPPPPPPEPAPKRLKSLDEIGDDFKFIGDEDLDVLDEVPAGAEEQEQLDSLEEVPDNELDSLEEVGAAVSAGRIPDPFSRSSIFRLSTIHVRGRLGSALGCYDLCDPHARRRLGEALEVRESSLMQSGGIMEATETARLEIREGRYGDLVAMLHRPADDPQGSTLLLVDEADQVWGRFQRIGWKKLTQAKPLWVTAERGRRIQIHLEEAHWRLVLKTEEGEEVGEMIAESTYEGRGVRPRWFARGASFYIRFRPTLDARPRDKVLFLAVVLGMEL
jgi:hypothetical protein